MRRLSPLSGLAPLAAPLLALLLAGCFGDSPSHPLSPQEMHSIRVSQTAMTLALDVTPAAGQLGPEDAARLDRFVDDFLQGGTGPLEIVAGERESAASPRVKATTERAIRRGVSGREIKLRLASLGGGPSQPLLLSYRRFIAEAPSCGHWNDSPSFNPSNNMGANFGCANQHNLAVSVANPSDLQAAAPLGSISAIRTDRVIGQYKQGKASESEKSDSNKASISQVQGGAQ